MKRKIGYLETADGSVFHITEYEEFPCKAAIAAKIADYALSPRISSLQYCGFGTYELGYEFLHGLKEISEEEFTHQWVKIVSNHLRQIKDTDGAFALNYKGSKERSMLLRAVMISRKEQL